MAIAHRSGILSRGKWASVSINWVSSKRARPPPRTFGPRSTTDDVGSCTGRPIQGHELLLSHVSKRRENGTFAEGINGCFLLVRPLLLAASHQLKQTRNTTYRTHCTGFQRSTLLHYKNPYVQRRALLFILFNLSPLLNDEIMGVSLFNYTMTSNAAATNHMAYAPQYFACVPMENTRVMLIQGSALPGGHGCRRKLSFFRFCICSHINKNDASTSDHSSPTRTTTDSYQNDSTLGWLRFVS
jgi:hypothetical protein